jgi:nicotinamide mononucleotide transporter
LFFAIIFYILATFTNSTVPAFDASTTALFIVAMWLMALKKIENWHFWILGDFLVIPMFAFKGLVFTSLQYIVFLALAVAGLMEWKRKMAQQKAS